VSLALSGSFFVSFLGSVVPRDITVNTYIKGLARAAALRAAGSARRFDAFGGDDSIPLNVLTPRRSSSVGMQATSMKSTDSQAVSHEKPMHHHEHNDYPLSDDRISMDVMEIL